MAWNEEAEYKTMAEHPEYPQTWAMVCHLKVIPDIGQELVEMVQKRCGERGHEWSKTEWGYAGGSKIDVWCRWCNFHSEIDFDEAIKIWPHIQPLYEQGLTGEAFADVLNLKEAEDET